MEPFWKTKSLAEMSTEEWESLCDGCGRCCLHALECETGQVIRTQVACRLLDTETCRCKQYDERFQYVPECLELRKLSRSRYHWLPESCAYRLLHEGQELPDWHPLNSGDSSSVHDAGISVRGICHTETEVDVTWYR